MRSKDREGLIAVVLIELSLVGAFLFMTGRMTGFVQQLHVWWPL